MQQNDSRPPYVEFKRLPVEDRTRSLAENRYVTKDVDFIIIVPHGSEGKTRIEQEYDLWLKKTKPMTGPKGFGADGHFEVASRFNPEWIEKIEQAYAKWKAGEDMDVEGTPLKNWPAISPGQLKMCLDLHIHSVEALAASADDAIERLGMGAYALRQRARDWLAASTGGSPKLTIELENLRADNDAKDVRIKSLEEQINALQTQVQALAAAAPAGRQRGTVAAG